MQLSTLRPLRQFVTRNRSAWRGRPSQSRRRPARAAILELLEDRALLSAIGAEWIDQFGTSSGDIAESVAVGADGSLYVAGRTQGPLVGEAPVLNSAAYLRKYHSDGTVAWTHQIGGTGSENSAQVAVGSDGSIYVGGSTKSNLTGLPGFGSFDGFLRKFSEDGTALWTRQFGSADSDQVNGIAVGADGNVYLIGTTSGAFPGQSFLGRTDAFLTHFHADGTLGWTRQYGTGAFDVGQDVEVAADGGVFVTGDTSGNLEGTDFNRHFTHVRKYDKDGAVVWTREFLYGSGLSLAAENDGSVIVAGKGFGFLDGQLSDADGFLRKYDSDGTIEWTQSFRTGSIEPFRNVSVADDGSIYVSGNTRQNVTNLLDDVFVSKYRNDGSLVLTHQFGTEGWETSTSIAVGANGIVYVAGYTYGAFEGELSQATPTSPDAFIAQFAFTKVTEPYTLSGMVYVDFNKDGEVNFGEGGIAGVTVQLIGTDVLGNAVQQTTTTDSDGYYGFFDLLPGEYRVVETQPDGYLQGLNSVGTLDGTLGTLDEILITLADEVLGSTVETDGLNYNFGEWLQAGAAFDKSYTASIGFWNNKHGQSLITSLSAGTTQLGDWLAATLSNMFGNLAGVSSGDVALHFQQLFALQGKKLEAQVMATALAVYATNSTLAGTVAESYGLTVTEYGVGNLTVNVGSSGAAFGVENDTTLSILDLLRATDERAEDGMLYLGDDVQLTRRLRNLAFEAYAKIN